MQHVQETDLAWALIVAAKPELDVTQRHHVFVSVGAGDSFTAIRIAIKLIAIKRISLRPSIVRLCMTWLEAYTQHEDYELLRILIDGLTTTGTNPRSLATVAAMPCPRGLPKLAASVDADEGDKGVSKRAG